MNIILVLDPDTQCHDRPVICPPGWDLGDARRFVEAQIINVVRNDPDEYRWEDLEHNLLLSGFTMPQVAKAKQDW